jgi:hypothetical protein
VAERPPTRQLVKASRLTDPSCHIKLELGARIRRFGFSSPTPPARSRATCVDKSKGVVDVGLALSDNCFHRSFAKLSDLSVCAPQRVSVRQAV